MDHTERVTAPGIDTADAALADTLMELEQLLSETNPDLLCLLLPEYNSSGWRSAPVATSLSTPPTCG
jgi:hypothetical protein